MQSDRFRAAAESKDFSGFEELFAPDVTFRSPAVFRPYEGRDAVAMLLATVVQVFEDFRYTNQVETGETAMLAFSATVGTRALDGVDLLRFGDDGKIREMAVYIRPLSGLTALAEAMQRKLNAEPL
jgi:SnoaL-like domain